MRVASLGGSYATIPSQAAKRGLETLPRVTATLVQLSTDDFGVSNVSGKSGQPVLLSITSSPQAPGDDLFTITGLPSEVELSAGTPYNDFWIVKRNDLHSLLMTPPGYSGDFKLSLTRARTLSRPPLTLNMNIHISDAPAKVEGGASARNQTRRALSPNRG